MTLTPMKLRSVAVAIALTCAPALTFAQWLRYPTAGVPRTADGKPNLTAPAPRLADGTPDFSDIWLTSKKIPCTPEFSKFVECGIEIGGSPLALNIGDGVSGGLPHGRATHWSRRRSGSGTVSGWIWPGIQ